MQLPIVTPAGAVRVASDLIGVGPRLLRLVTDVEGLVPRIVALVSAIEQIAVAAGDVVGGADQMLGRAGGVVDDAAPLVARIDDLLERLEPSLKTLQPTLETFAQSISPEEVEAMVALIDQMPELTASLRDDVLPIMRTMDHVSEDLHDLMLLARELNEMLANVPGVRRILSRDIGNR